MARPVLHAMQVDELHNFHYRRELFSELNSPADSNHYNDKFNGRRAFSSFVPSFSSDEGNRNRLARRSFNDAISFSSNFSKVIAQNIRDYEENYTRQFDQCCEKESITECLFSAHEPFIRNMLKASMIKLLLILLSTRSVAKTIEQLRFQIPRFGATFGLAGALFHLTICFFRRLKNLGKIAISEK